METELAKVFCRMSFAPSIYPCVETHSAAKAFNRLTFSNFNADDFAEFVSNLFGEDTHVDCHIFRLKPTDFYEEVESALKAGDGDKINRLYKNLLEVRKASVSLGGGDNIEILS